MRRSESTYRAACRRTPHRSGGIRSEAEIYCATGDGACTAAAAPAGNQCWVSGIMWTDSRLECGARCTDERHPSRALDGKGEFIHHRPTGANSAGSCQRVNAWCQRRIPEQCRCVHILIGARVFIVCRARAALIVGSIAKGRAHIRSENALLHGICESGEW